MTVLVAVDTWTAVAVVSATFILYRGLRRGNIRIDDKRNESVYLGSVLHLWLAGENRQLVTNEPVEVQDYCRKNTDNCRGIYGIYPSFIKENRRMSTCNRLDLQTLGSQPVMPKLLPDRWFTPWTMKLDHGRWPIYDGPIFMVWFLKTTIYKAFGPLTRCKMPTHHKLNVLIFLLYIQNGQVNSSLTINLSFLVFIFSSPKQFHKKSIVIVFLCHMPLGFFSYPSISFASPTAKPIGPC